MQQLIAGIGLGVIGVCTPHCSNERHSEKRVLQFLHNSICSESDQEEGAPHSAKKYHHFDPYYVKQFHKCHSGRQVREGTTETIYAKYITYHPNLLVV